MREYKQQLFIFTKLHTDICSLVINKINFEDLKYLAERKINGYRLSEKCLKYYYENINIVGQIEREYEIKREYKIRRERERKKEQNKYIRIGFKWVLVLNG